MNGRDGIFVQKKEGNRKMEIKKDKDGLLLNTIGELLDINAEIYPDQDAVVFCEQNKRYTWKQLKEICDQVAKGFLHLCIKKGDHIAIWGTNVPEWLITQLAAAKIGAPLVPMNPEWKAEELAYALKQSDIKTLILLEKFNKISGSGKLHEYNYLKILNKVCPELANSTDKELKCAKAPKLKNVILISDNWRPGTFRWKNVVEMGFFHTDNLLKERQKLVTSKNPAMLVSTSGTTGFPKCAVLTHYNVVNNAAHVARNIDITHQDIICGQVPYYHCFGGITLTLSGLVSGATVIIPSQHFDAKKNLEAVEKEKCTAIYGVPTMFSAELAHPDFYKFDLTSLRTGVLAGESCPVALMENIINKMHAKEITIGYGFTEASPFTHQGICYDSKERRISTVGRPITGVEAKIVDPETLRELPVGKVGEIWVRGYNVMQGYYNKPKETAKVLLEGGWFRSGDLGKKDNQGYYNIIGRVSEDMFTSGGENIYTVEVENIIRENFDEFLEEVRVVGVPDEKYTKVGAAWIKLISGKTLTVKEIQDKVAEKSDWRKAPKYIKFADIPDEALVLPSRKIKKRVLRELLTKELGLEKLAQRKTA